MAYSKGDTIILWCEVRSADTNELMDPSDGVKLSLWDPANGLEVVDATMIRDVPPVVGKYHYNYQTTVASIAGDYAVEFKAVNGSNIAVEPYMFNLR